MIRFENVTYRYGAQGPAALCGVDLAFEPARLTVVLGANGSGKSTLARLANGLLLPSEGVITVGGIDTRDDERALELRSGVGMVFQNPDDQIVATSVEDDVAFGPENLGLPRSDVRLRVDAAIEATGLTGLEGREPHLLSGGQKQRLAIAGALAMRPRYLVLDEPLSMVDAAGRIEVTRVLAKVLAAGQGVVLITHDLAEAMHADHVVVLAAGLIVFEGGPLQLLEQGDRLEAWGLELPDVVRLSAALASRDFDVAPHETDPARIAESLWV